MAFGQELKDFVGGFTTGYKLVDSPDEKAYKKEVREREKAKFDRDGVQQGVDNDYRASRASRSDVEFDKNYDFRVDESGRLQGRFDRSEQMERDKMSLDAAKDTNGMSGADAAGGYKDPYATTPNSESTGTPEKPKPASETGDQTSNNEYSGDGAIQLASYSPRASENTSSSAFNLPSYLRSIRSAESGGNDRAKNDSSSATGRYQFLRGTWDRLAQKNPELGLTPDGRTDPVQQERAIKKFTFDNAKALDSAGIPITNGSLYAAHFLGSGGARKVLSANPGASVAQLVSPAVLAANPFLRGMSVASFERWASRKAGQASPARKPEGAINAAVGGMVDRSILTGAIPVGDDEEPNDDPVMVEPEETELAPIVVQAKAPEGALPVEGPMPTPRPEYEGAEEGNKEPPTNDRWENARRAVRDGLKHALGDQKDGVIDDPRLEAQRQRYLKGYGAAPQQMMREVMDTIDPDKKMAPAERNMAAIGEVYKYYTEKGEFGKAKEAAASMIQYHRQAAGQFLALAQAAAEGGDLDKAAKAAVAAYTNVPNGRDMKIEKGEGGRFNISIVDEKTGKTVHKQVMSPDEFGAAAMQFNPTTFDEEILRAAGVPAETHEGAKGEQLGKIEDEVGVAADTVLEGSPLNDAQKAGVRDLAANIRGIEDNGMGGDEAARFASRLIQFDKDNKDNDKPNYKVTKIPLNKDQVKVTMDGETVVMSKGKVAKLEQLRAGLAKERVAGREKDAKSKENWDYLGDLTNRTIDAFSDVVVGDPDPVAVDRNKERHDKINSARSQMGAIPLD